MVVGFFENDLTDNRPIPDPSRLRRSAVQLLSIARRHVYSLEFYKQVYLTGVWRLSGSDDYRRRVEHLGTEEGLLSSTSDASTLPQQQLTPFTWLSDAEVRQINCIEGMKPNPGLIPAMQNVPGYADWLAAVRGFQQLHTRGQHHIAFFLNDVPPVCPDGDNFYDGARAVDDFFLQVLSRGTPAVSTYEAFLHVRPSQMPNATGHPIGNSNVVKADVLFGFLRANVLPALMPGSVEPSR